MKIEGNGCRTRPARLRRFVSTYAHLARMQCHSVSCQLVRAALPIDLLCYGDRRRLRQRVRAYGQTDPLFTLPCAQGEATD